jgi:hypothetical protein
MRRSILTWVTAAIAALAPAWVLAGDQETAQQVAANLRNSGKLKGYAIDVKAADGTVMLNGTVTSKEQLSAALRIAGQTAGVEDVVNNLSVTGSAGGGVNLRQPGIPTSAVQQQQQQPAPRKAGGGSGVPLGFAPAGQLGNEGAVMAASANCDSGVGANGQPIPAYMPGSGGGGVAPASFDHPHMPNYSWPSYAAYPNYAAVTYPQQYSPTAWPYIGPFYPYPQVPLGWRKVSLEWDDGWWFLEFDDRVHHHHRGAQCH